MPIPFLLGAVLTKMAENGLETLAAAITQKGKQVVEEKLGVKLPEKPEDLTPEKVTELTRLQIQHEEFLVADAAEGQREVTRRWESDMTSDSWLSKNIRPMTLAYWTVAITLLIVLDSAGTWFQVKKVWIDLIETSYSIVLAAYFVGRTIQHGVKTYNDRKSKAG